MEELDEILNKYYVEMSNTVFSTMDAPAAHQIAKKKLKALIATHEKQLLERVGKEVIGEDAHQVGSIPISSAQARMNRQKYEMRTKLDSLTKSIERGE